MKSNDIFSQSSPIYLQLYERLKSDIISGVYKTGERFPSKRVIGDRYAVSLVTVEHALQLLMDEGYIVSRQRSGCRVIYSERSFYGGTQGTWSMSMTDARSSSVLPAAQPASSTQAPSDLPADLPLTDAQSRPGPDLSGSSSHGSFNPGLELFPFSAYARTMRRVIQDYGEQLLERVPGCGVLKLREAICSYLARSRGIRVTPEHVVIGAGSEYLYSLIVQLFGRDCIFGIEAPSYIKIEKVYRSNGAQLEMLTLGPDGITSDSLAASQADILHISPYRSYPSGISTTASKRREYIRWADMHGAYIVEDDFESEFTTSSKPEETVYSLSDHDNVLYLNSFTRTISPSTRISYLILPGQLLGAYSERLGYLACTVPAFDQYVLAEFIESGEFERHINRVRRRLRDIAQADRA